MDFEITPYSEIRDALAQTGIVTVHGPVQLPTLLRQ